MKKEDNIIAQIEIDLEKAIHFDPEKIKKMYGGDYKKVAKDLAIENTKLHIINSSKEQENKRLNNIINELEKWIKENNLGKYRTENVVNTDELLDKLQELKEKE